MALVFRHSAEEPARCALEIAEALRKHPELPVRMGIHSGRVSEVTDVSGRTNIAGAGINMAQRVMGEPHVVSGSPLSQLSLISRSRPRCFPGRYAVGRRGLGMDVEDAALLATAQRAALSRAAQNNEVT